METSAYHALFSLGLIPIFTIETTNVEHITWYSDINMAWHHWSHRDCGKIHRIKNTQFLYLRYANWGLLLVMYQESLMSNTFQRRFLYTIRSICKWKNKIKPDLSFLKKNKIKLEGPKYSALELESTTNPIKMTQLYFGFYRELCWGRSFWDCSSRDRWIRNGWLQNEKSRIRVPSSSAVLGLMTGECYN